VMTGQLNRGDATVTPLRVPSGSRLLGPPASQAETSWSPAPSPDGDRVAHVSDRSGSPRVWVGEDVLDTGPHPVVSVSWSPDGTWLACLLAPGGAPRTEVWLVRPDGSDLHQVAGFATANAWLPHWAGRRLAVTEDAAGLLIDPATGARTAVAEGALVALLDVTRDGRRALLRRGPRGARSLSVRDLVTDQEHSLVRADCGAFSRDGRHVYARSDEGCELARLVRLPVDGPPHVTVLAERADAELESFAVTGDALALVWNVHGGTGELTVLKLACGRQRAVPLTVPVVDSPVFSADGRTLACTVEGPGQPRSVTTLSRGSWTVGVPIGPASVQDRGGVVAPELRELVSADGLTITGWLYRPAGEGPHPTVLSLHAGPESQERPGYNPLFQSLVDQGVAVFAPNVRGSSGFGRSFVNADNREGRYGAIADVAACVAHLVDAGIAEPGRIGCMGRSYGGYLTLAALVTYPELFAVGVDVCGMANFATFYAHTEPWIAAAAVGKYGHPEHDRKLLRDLSPLTRIDRLTAPLLVVHGANDTNVPVCEAEQVVAALRAGGVPHRYLLFEDEGHDFLSRANREAYVVAAVAWLTHHLKATDLTTAALNAEVPALLAG
jgi:dipeptidyl aminopeptidase/acylaminoacyl peptidase